MKLLSDKKQKGEREFTLGIDFGDANITFAATNNADISVVSRFPATVTFNNGELITGKKVSNTLDESVTDFIYQNPSALTDGRQVPLVLYLKNQIKTFEQEVLKAAAGTVDFQEKSPSETPSLSFHSAVLSLPAGVTSETISAIVEIVESLGISDVQPIRRPTPTVRDFNQGKTDEVILGIHLTNNRLELGLYSTTSQEIEVLARKSYQDLGRRYLSNAIARRVLELTARDLESTVEYDETALQQVIEVVDTVLSDDNTQGEQLIELELDDGIRLVAGNEIISNRLFIEETLDQSLVKSAIDDYTSQLIDCLSTFVDSTPDSRVTSAVISGSYPALTVFNDVVEGIWNIEPHLSDHPFKQMARAAAKIPSSEDVKLTETTDYLFSIAALSESGVESRPLSEIQRSTNRPFSFTLRTQSPNQQLGKFKLQFRHPITDDIEVAETVTLAGLQLSEEKTTVRVRCNPTSKFVSGADQLTFHIETPADEDIQLTKEDKSDIPWLVHEDVPEDADLPKLSEDRLSYAQLTDFDSNTDATVDRERVAEIIHRTRTNIWAHSIKKGQEFSPSQMETVLREFDSQLKRIGIEFFEPEIGTETDPGRHRVRGVEKSQEEEGTILEVLRPGVTVNGEIAINAEVVIADD